MEACYIGAVIDGKLYYIQSREGLLGSTGVKLQLAYNSFDRVKQLLNLGDIYSVGYNIQSPKAFKDNADVNNYKYYASQHLTTTSTIALQRDMNDKTASNKAKVGDFEKFRFGAYNVYYYNVKLKCWYVLIDIINGSKHPFKLEKLLTFEAYYQKCAGLCELNEKWDRLSAEYERYKWDLEHSGAKAIVENYNIWLASVKKYNIWTATLEKCARSDLEFGLAVRDGKQIYALLEKNNGTSRRRKVVKCSEYIWDLARYALNGYDVTTGKFTDFNI